MRTHVDPAAPRELRRTDVIEEDEGANRLQTRGRKHPAYFEATEVASPAFDHAPHYFFPNRASSCARACSAAEICSGR